MIRANSYGNFSTVLLIAILGITLMNSISMGGGIGLAFTAMTMIGYLGIYCALSISGGICAGALRVTKSLKFIQWTTVNAHENNVGSR